ncbi:MAG TPA: DUF2103 domain-containing protein [Candidatus Atribacteria bacterium]|nr:DUF2103 domain-containing protein [Candidatus Atribacteria bacterium]HPU08384.1 DUF2103 domain-containing protein [Candidatus Atribacteria bacterium]HPZ81674.1 DUF2103 domain-containing protein [Candidatus Atribacteria bacterium]HQE25251.1 DUF2103 domain-containing protein [Candidatus Atribacteria bacterium]
MKHRAKNSKIKYEHSMIPGLRNFLEREIEPLEFVKSIFPGEIKRTKGTTSGLVVRFKYSTPTGAKLLAQKSSAVQEIFVVTTEPEILRKIIVSQQETN